ncbi:MAG: hypothetical protein IJI74_01660 [Firmicutes bacterium]|nr:hypothetical protein [Bacillota bacterium]
MITVLIVIVAVIVMVIIGSAMMRKDKGNGKEDDDKIVTSQSLHEQVNRERQREGMNTIEAINTIGGTSTSNLARKDKSWNSVPDFFIKMTKGEDGRPEAEESAEAPAEAEVDAPVEAEVEAPKETPNE